MTTIAKGLGYTEHDEAIDRYNDGVLAALRGQTRPVGNEHAAYIEGYEDGLVQHKVRVVMPSRPEGYYHSPVGTFE